MRRLTYLSLAAAAALLAAAAPGTAATSSSASGLDKEYIKTSIEGDRFEIAGGKLALSKSHNAAVRALGARLVKDHSASLSDTLKLAKRFGVEAPKKPSESQQWELSIVGRQSGTAFDHWYSDLETLDHIQDLQDASDEIKDGSNPAVRDDAKTEVPTLRTHLKMSRAALKASG